MYAGAMLFSYFFTPNFWHFQLIYDYNTKTGYFSPADVLVIITIGAFTWLIYYFAISFLLFQCSTARII